MLWSINVVQNRRNFARFLTMPKQAHTCKFLTLILRKISTTTEIVCFITVWRPIIENCWNFFLNYRHDDESLTRFNHSSVCKKHVVCCMTHFLGPIILWSCHFGFKGNVTSWESTWKFPSGNLSFDALVVFAIYAPALGSASIFIVFSWLYSVLLVGFIAFVPVLWVVSSNSCGTHLSSLRRFSARQSTLIA